MTRVGLLYQRKVNVFPVFPVVHKNKQLLSASAVALWPPVTGVCIVVSGKDFGYSDSERSAVHLKTNFRRGHSSF